MLLRKLALHIEKVEISPQTRHKTSPDEYDNQKQNMKTMRRTHRSMFL